MGEDVIANFSLKRLAADAAECQSQYAHCLRQTFVRFSALDQDLSSMAIRALGNEDAAAHWLASPLKTLGNATPLEAIGEGKRRQVVDILTRIEHGVY